MWGSKIDKGKNQKMSKSSGGVLMTDQRVVHLGQRACISVHIVQDTINGLLWLFVDTSDDSGEFGAKFGATQHQRSMGVAIRLRPSR